MEILEKIGKKEFTIEEYAKLCDDSSEMEIISNLSKLVKSGVLREIGKDPVIYERVEREEGETKKLKRFTSRLLNRLPREFRYSDLEKITQFAQTHLSSWLKIEAVRSIGDDVYMKVDGDYDPIEMPKVTVVGKIDLESIKDRKRPVNIEKAEESDIPDDLENYELLADEIINRMETKTKSLVLPSRIIKSSKEEEQFTELCSKVNKCVLEKIVAGRKLSFPTIIVRPNINQKTVSVITNPINVTIVFVKLGEVIDMIKGLEKTPENMEYLIRYYRHALIYISDKFKSPVVVDQITPFFEELKNLEEEYLRIFKKFSSEPCPYCSKKFSFITMEQAQAYVKENKARVLRQLLEKGTDPTELKTIGRAYYSDECGCYHITSKPRKGDLLTPWLIVIDLGEKVLEIFRDTPQAFLPGYKSEVYREVETRLDFLLHTEKSKVSEVEELRVKAEVLKQDIQVARKELSLPSDIVSVNPDMEILELQKIKEEIYDAYFLKSYKEVKILIGRSEKVFQEMSPKIKLARKKEIIECLGKIAMVKLNLPINSGEE